jgi:GT2 family glycosyltransferase
MPIFNGERYLAEAIESVLDQTLRDLELVAVDDGSLDGSREIVERFARADSRVRLIASSAHLGVSGVLNLGWRDARAAYVAIAHADDIALSERFSRQAAFLDGHPRVAVVGSRVITIDGEGRRGSILRFPTDVRVIHTTLLHHNCLAHPSVMVRRAALEAVGGYRFDAVEDYDLWLRISEGFDLANLGEPLVLYRIHEGQTSFLALEEMERRRLAVRAAARARRLAQPDPLAGARELTPDVLAAVEIDQRELARSVETEWLSRAAILAELEGEGVEELVARASRTLGPRAGRAFIAARELKRAESLLGAGRPISGVWHVLLAFRHEPVYAFSRLSAWLGDRLRDRRPPRRG